MTHRSMPAIVAGLAIARAMPAAAAPVGPVFVIAMENHNFQQPANQFTGSLQQIYRNPVAPYINSLVIPGRSQRRADLLGS